MYPGHQDADATPRLEETPFRLAFDQGPIGMALVGLDWRVQQVNQALCAALGYDAHELLAHSFGDLIDSDDAARDVAFAERLVRGEILPVHGGAPLPDQGWARGVAGPHGPDR